ncbi:carbon-nitrogen hydrolase [Aspergillus cavernicola]|uniref:Carbon-nitrogen hydrolase n=1 Tax=Aspergillus cavernicola TaxID=176166 RepID=A0ABR4HSU4_9EURO
MRIATLQFAPKLGDVEGNIRRADEVLKNSAIKAPSQGTTVGIEEAGLDILVLPELALTGYNFPSLAAIKPYTEPSGQGPSATWARQTAKRLGCKVCVGYPEHELDSTTHQEKYYNSLLVVDEQGEVLLNYRKTFLYYTDDTWASEGSAELGFHRLDFPSSSSRTSRARGVSGASVLNASTDDNHHEPGIATSFGICMDINPYRFEAPYTACEFANRVLDSKSQLVILSMAWLTTLSREDLDALAGKADMDTFSYWIQRFMPLIQKKMAHLTNADTDGDPDSKNEKKIILVFSNRAGEEDGIPLARYAGTSAIIAISQRLKPQLQPGPGPDLDRDSSGSSDEEEGPALDVKIICWNMLGATSEGVCFADTMGDPTMVFPLVRAART